MAIKKGNGNVRAGNHFRNFLLLKESHEHDPSKKFMKTPSGISSIEKNIIIIIIIIHHVRFLDGGERVFSAHGVWGDSPRGCQVTLPTQGDVENK